MDYTQLKNCVHACFRIIPRNAFNGLTDRFAIFLRECAHHSHIEINDFSILNTNISRMRVSVKKAILCDLLDIIIRQFAAYFV